MHTVLLIEDNVEIASMLRVVLARGGHRALLAGTLAEAEQIWSASKAEIQVVVTDNSLPDGSGISYAKRLLQEKPKLKVIVASGLAGSNLPAGFHRMDKPFTISAFIKALRQALDDPDPPQPPLTLTPAPD